MISVIKPRISEIVHSINEFIIESSYNNIIANRVVITGGVSQMDGILDFSSNILEKKARLAKPQNIKALPENMKSPSFSTVCSLINFSIVDYHDINMNLLNKNHNSDNYYVYFKKIKNWFVENF